VIHGEEVKHLPFVRIAGGFRFEGLEETAPEG
jgi:hypothetical protein